MWNQRTKHTCTISFDGSPKGKTDYGQSSKTLFKQKWGIYPKFKVLVHFWLDQIYLLKAQNIAKLKLFKKHPQEY